MRSLLYLFNSGSILGLCGRSARLPRPGLVVGRKFREVTMQRRTKVLLLLVPLLSIAAGIILWLVWLPPWATPLEKRLLGAWEGNGTISGEFSLEIDPDLDRNVSGHKIAGTVTSDSTVQAEFSPDGTYTWYEQQQ